MTDEEYNEFMYAQAQKEIDNEKQNPLKWVFIGFIVTIIVFIPIYAVIH